MSASVAAKPRGPRPVLVPDCCKGCGRCIEACARHCIEEGAAIHPATGLVPVRLHLEDCTACGLCFAACPEPYGLRPDAEGEVLPPEPMPARGPIPVPIPDEWLPLPASAPLVVKGNHAAAIGAILAGCRHVFGYPITPSTEGAELLAEAAPPGLGGVVPAGPERGRHRQHGVRRRGGRPPDDDRFLRARLQLMHEGISYMVGAELPCVIVNVTRAAPGSVTSARADRRQARVVKGGGHGNTHAIVLRARTAQEMSTSPCCLRRGPSTATRSSCCRWLPRPDDGDGRAAAGEPFEGGDPSGRYAATPGPIQPDRVDPTCCPEATSSAFNRT